MVFEVLLGHHCRYVEWEVLSVQDIRAYIRARFLHIWGDVDGSRWATALDWAAFTLSETKKGPPVWERANFQPGTSGVRGGERWG